MRSVSYQFVQSQVASALAWDPNNLSSDEANLINWAINRRARYGWTSFFWPEMTLMERRTFRQSWSASTNYVAQNEVIYLATKKYYCCLAANTNQPPADINGNTNLAYWAESQGSYVNIGITSGFPGEAGFNVQGNYNPATTYTQGMQVYYPNTDTSYQLYFLTSLNVPPADINGNVNAGWGVLVPFERNITYTQAWQANTIDAVKNVYDRNPRTDPSRACPLTYWLQDDGVRVTSFVPVVYVEFRKQNPTWTGALYAGGTNYGVGAQVEFLNPSTNTSDFYACIQNTTGTQDPTNASFWSVISFPYVLAQYCAQGSFADLKSKTEDNEQAAPLENDEAFKWLEFEWDLIERQQQQTTQMNVRTGPGTGQYA